MNPPRVSIVMATYNRSNVLRYAIETVRWQTVEDWELIVIGDACTDDTPEVVASFHDPRIRFVNREENFGEQSVPNNDGVALSRGTYLAFLNHDDLWLPTHLEASLEALAGCPLDLVYPLSLVVRPDHTRVVANITPATGYNIHSSIPASTWVMTREVAAAVGPWRSHDEIYGAPSQEWLRRAFRAGYRFRLIEHVTSVLIQSGGRLGSYSSRAVEEHDDCFRDIQRPGWLLECLEEIVVQEWRWSRRASWGHLRRAALNVAKRVLSRLGLPIPLVIGLRYGKGGYINFLRANRGLPKLRRRS